MVESNKFARKTVRTGWYSEKKNEPVDDPVHIREVAQLKTEITKALKAWDWLDGNYYCWSKKKLFSTVIENFCGSNQSDRIDWLLT